MDGFVRSNNDVFWGCLQVVFFPLIRSCDQGSRFLIYGALGYILLAFHCRENFGYLGELGIMDCSAVSWLFGCFVTLRTCAEVLPIPSLLFTSYLVGDFRLGVRSCFLFSR